MAEWSPSDDVWAWLQAPVLARVEVGGVAYVKVTLNAAHPWRPVGGDRSYGTRWLFERWRRAQQGRD